MLLFMPLRAGLYDYMNSCQLSTWLGDPMVLRPHNQRQLVPWTHPLSFSPRNSHWKPQGGGSQQNSYSVCAEPQREQEWRQPGRWKAQTQKRQAVFQDTTVSNERRYMTRFLLEHGSGWGSSEDSLLRSSCIIQKVAEKGWDGRGRRKRTVYFPAESSIVQLHST